MTCWRGRAPFAGTSARLACSRRTPLGTARGDQEQLDGNQGQSDGNQVQSDGNQGQLDGDQVQSDGNQGQLDGDQVQSDGDKIRRLKTSTISRFAVSVA